MIEHHSNALAMVRVLVQYMPSNIAIQREVEASLGRHVSLSEISRMRSMHNRAPITAKRSHDSSVVWMDERYANDMDHANRKFVEALFQARAA